MNHDLTTHAGQIANIKAVRARIAAAAYRPKPIKTDEVTIVRHVKKSEYWDVPTWKLQRTWFDDHVKRWQMRLVSTPSDWLRDRCKDVGITYEVMTGHSRRRELVKIRQMLVWEAYNKFGMSLPQLGRMFGGRDHTTILHALRRHEGRLKCE